MLISHAKWAENRVNLENSHFWHWCNANQFLFFIAILQLCKHYWFLLQQIWSFAHVIYYYHYCTVCKIKEKVNKWPDNNRVRERERENTSIFPFSISLQCNASSISVQPGGSTLQIHRCLKSSLCFISWN